MIKVIGGEFGGRILASVPGENTRPPLARVRAAVANILAPYIPESSVLDLFAGTGSYSIELLSRGALRATCIDLSPQAIQVIRKNISSLGIEGRVRVIQGDALRTAQSLESAGEVFQIVLVAPPYFKGLDQAALDYLSKSNLVDPPGIVVMQQHKREEFKEEYGRLALRKTYLYGETRICTYVPSR